MSDLFADIQPDLFADVPRDPRAAQRARGWNTSLARLTGQAAAGFATTPVDVTFGMAGLFGNETGQRVQNEWETKVNTTLGVDNPHWYYNTPEFLARTAGGALVGVPARFAGVLGRIRSPAARALEAVTPITLPLTAGNVALNTIGGAVVGAGLQALGDVELDARLGELPPERPVPTQPNLFDDLPEQPRTLAGRVLEYVPEAVLAGAAVAGGAAGVRQFLRNRAASRAADQTGGLVDPNAAFNMETLPNGERVPVVAPESIAERVERTVLDDTATIQNRLNRAAREGAAPRAAVDEVNAGFATNVYQAPLQDRTNEAMRSGDFDGIRFTGSEDYEIKRNALRNADIDSFTLYMNARAALNELDDRAINARTGKLDPVTGQPMPRTLSHQTTQQLEDIAKQARSNPTVRALLDEDAADNAAMRQVFIREGLFEASEVQKMANVRPGYLHTLLPDNTPLTRRNMSPYQEPAAIADPILARQNAWQEVIAMAIENRQRKQVYQLVEQINQNMPDALRKLGIGITGDLATVRKNQQAGTEIIPVRINGKTYGMELAPEVAAGLRVNARATVPVLTAMAQLQRNATTGAIAALFGYVQAAVSAAYGTSMIAITRPRGTSAGFLDKLTKGRLPIADPTFAAAVPVRAALDIGAEIARAASSQMMRSIYSKGPLAATLNAVGVDARKLQQRLENVYRSSQLYNMRMNGSTGTGLAYDPLASETLRLAQMALTPEYAKTLPIDPRNNPVMEYARMTGRMVTPSAAQRSWRLFTTMLNIISDSPVSAYVWFNRGAMPDQFVHGTARRLQGDPAARGSSKLVQQATSVMNYSNITLQAQRQLVRALREQPVRTVGSILAIAGTAAMARVLSAVQADEEEGGNRHMQHLLTADPSSLVNGTYIHIAGIDPANAMRLPIEPVIGIAVGMATTLLANSVAQENGVVIPGLEGQMDAFLSGRVGPTMMTAASRGLNPLSPPPGFDALMQLAGGPSIENLFDITNPRVPSTPRDRGVPGYSDRRLVNDPISRSVDLIMADILSSTGEQVLTFARHIGYGRETDDALRNMMTQGVSRNTMIAPLLQPVRPQSQRGMIGEQLSAIETVAERVGQGFMQSVVMQGATVGSGNARRPLPADLPTQTPPPESITGLLAQVRQVHNAIQTLRDQRKAQQDEIIAIRSAALDVNEQNARVNERVRTIQELNAQMLNAYLTLERSEQRRTGRAVRISQLDPMRGIEQFPAIAE